MKATGKEYRARKRQSKAEIAAMDDDAIYRLRIRGEWVSATGREWKAAAK